MPKVMRNSVTDWVSGMSYPVISVFHLPKALEPGTYYINIALVDEAGKPRIKLGIAGGDAKGRYRLGAARISQNHNTPH